MVIGRRLDLLDSTQKDSSNLDEASIVAFTSEVKLLDLVLPSSTQSELLDFIFYKKNEPIVFDKWGLARTHGRKRNSAINLYGPPGTGKTMAAHAIAYELGLPLIEANYAELESKYVGDTSKNITQLFSIAEKTGSIIFFDEADAILSRRVTNMTQATDVSVNQTRSVMLLLMNNHPGVVVFATNFIENYDAAFMRRITAHVKFDLPDESCRLKIWKTYIPPELPFMGEVDVLARSSDGLSGSDISTCVLKAAMSAARENVKEVGVDYFLIAIKEILESKMANAEKGGAAHFSTKDVSEQYVVNQIGEDAMRSGKK